MSRGADSLIRLHREMEHLFDNALHAFGMPRLGRSLLDNSLDQGDKAFYRPRLDVSGNEKQYLIELDVPGLSESDLSIEVKGDILRVQGTKEEKTETKDKQFYRVERIYGTFQRTLSLPEDADADAIQANLKDGVLELKIPRKKINDSDVKQIAISS